MTSPDKQPTKAEKKQAARTAREVRDGQIAKKRQLRRNLLKLGLLSGGILTLGGTGVAVAPYFNHSKYDGPVRDLAGLDLLDRSGITELTSSLQNTGHPFLAKIGADIDFLTSTNSKPAEFPDWVSDRTFPMAVTYDKSNTAYAAQNGEFHPRPDGLPSLSPESRLFYADQVKNVDMATHIIKSPELVKDGTLAQAFFLAKEHITHMFFIGAARNYYQIVQQAGYSFVDYNQQIVTDHLSQQQAGEVIFMRLVKNPSTELHKIWDMIPAMLLATPAWELRSTGKLPLKGLGIGSFYTPGDYFSNQPDLKSVLEQVRSQWTAQKTLLPPGELTQIAQTEPLKSYMLKFRLSLGM